MRTPVLALASALIAISTSGCVTTSADGVAAVSHDKIAKSGQRDRVGHAWHINPDCSVTRRPTVRVVEPPAHGKLALIEEQEVLEEAKGRFAKCNSLKLPMIGYYYQSTSAYIGADRFVVRVSFGNGSVKDSIINIQVQK
jgi:hypothetical protein